MDGMYVTAVCIESVLQPEVDLSRSTKRLHRARGRDQSLVSARRAKKYYVSLEVGFGNDVHFPAFCTLPLLG